MEIWLIVLLVLAVVVGAGGWAGVVGLQRRMLASRQQRWRELESRFNRVTLDVERYEHSPGDALAAPGWLDRSSPVIRGFSGTLKRAHRERGELERSIEPAPGRAVRPRGSENRDAASRLNPSAEDLQRFELLVERLEDAYRDADRAVRLAGWSTPDSLQVPHPQFLLDPRWGHPAVLPRLGTVDPKGARRSVKEFLDCAFPLRKDAALKALKERAGSGHSAYLAQQALEHLIKSGRYTMDRQGFLWPASTVVEHWGTYRTFGRTAHLKPQDVPPVEFANALWALLPADGGMRDEELLTAAVDHLDLNTPWGAGLAQNLNERIARAVDSLPDAVRRTVNDAVPHRSYLPSPKLRVDQLLVEGLQEGLITGRLQRQPDGLIRRLRVDWPSTYRY
ncbi:hypothetical protein [Citricoccus sp. GCM10030269]|uniref:hypothetical protein n=1 Tax=Citricoccus sp. GCM10030269 TaxID=3273388 RepID=UPI0036181364